MAVKERIDVEGNFKKQLDDLISSLSKSNNAVKNLTENIVQSAKQSENSMSYFNRRVNTLASDMIKQGNTIKDSLIQATKQVEKEQEASIERVARQYVKLGSTIQDAYKNAKNAVGITYNATPSNFDSAEASSSNGMGDLIKSFIGSKLGKGLTALTVITSVVKGIQTTFKLANTISSQTLNAMNTLTGNMISEEGLKESLQNAMDFEDVKTNIDVLSKQFGFNGQKIYSDATNLAMATRFTEKEVAENAVWMLKAGVQPTQELMTQLANLASLKPQLGADHAGFVVFDSMNGRSGPLKNYGVNNEVMYAYQKTLSGDEKSSTENAIIKKGSGFTVKDKQAYADLFTLYMQSHYKDLAQQQSTTLSGLVSTMTGAVEQLSSDLMGFNTKKGDIENGSVIAVIKKAMGSMDAKTGTGTGFLGWLAELKDNPAFLSIQQQLGSLVQEIINVGSELNSSGFINEMMNVASEFIGEIGDFLKELQESGQLTQLLKDLPNLVKASLNYELAKAEAITKIAPFIPTMTQFLDKLTGIVNWFNDKPNTFRQEEGLEDGKIYFGKTPYEKKLEGDNTGTSSFTDWIKGVFSSDSTKTSTKSFADVSAKQWIDKYADVTPQKKDEIKEMIKNDNQNHYTITINGGESNQEMVKLLIDEIERIQANS